ncbi:hypothetical protein CupriaWKF_08875 [Cupriavidus sp. WKF15]|uniref:hypothetical protein n=1 Tax=Cupriavidus sp. WKF15 TaxID=3032282 RepID=UPI0023E180AF|nr:hypothetical protein [Cupriavidus sp. WKF15]WER44477.1 hypothetical protein CupriaWKF_08875 [Cupriavidus sp. WKF15]
MEPQTGYWQLWHLTSRGMCYCALASASLDGAAPGWRTLHPHLPLRDRYAPEKTLRAVVAYREARGEIIPPEGIDSRRLLHFAYASWSSRLKAPLQE